VKTWVNRSDLSLYHKFGPNSGKDYPEVAKVLDGAPSANMVRVDESEEVIVSVAVPIKSMHAIQGALLLTTRGGDINEVAERQQLTIIKVFLAVTGVMVFLSLVLVSTNATHVCCTAYVGYWHQSRRASPKFSASQLYHLTPFRRSQIPVSMT
jgi:two-component system, OmpR family, sensor histidine kinase ChvG